MNSINRKIMVKEGLPIVAVLNSRCSYHILLALNIADGDENVLHDGHLLVRVMSTFYNRESILIGVYGSRLLRCHDVISIYILLWQPVWIFNVTRKTQLLPHSTTSPSHWCGSSAALIP